MTTPLVMQDSAKAPARAGGGGVRKIVVLVAALVGMIAAFKFLPIGGWLELFLEYVESLGIWGPVLLAVAYIVATVFMIPGTPLTLGAGFLFGPVLGTITVSVASTVGAALAFLVGRFFARDFVEGLIQKSPKFAAVNQAVEQSGFKIIALTRLSPVFPFNVLNYLYGATKVSFKNYTLASWLGMVPGTALYVCFGAAAQNLTQVLAGEFEGGVGQKVLFSVGLFATVVVTIYVTKIAGTAIKKCVPAEGRSAPQGG